MDKVEQLFLSLAEEALRDLPDTAPELDEQTRRIAAQVAREGAAETARARRRKKSGAL